MYFLSNFFVAANECPRTFRHSPRGSVPTHSAHTTDVQGHFLKGIWQLEIGIWSFARATPLLLRSMVKGEVFWNRSFLGGVKRFYLHACTPIALKFGTQTANGTKLILHLKKRGQCIRERLPAASKPLLICRGLRFSCILLAKSQWHSSMNCIVFPTHFFLAFYSEIYRKYLMPKELLLWQRRIF